MHTAMPTLPRVTRPAGLAAPPRGSRAHRGVQMHGRRPAMTAPSEQHPPPKQEQDYPGHTAAMDPRPRDEMHDYEGTGLMAGQRALVTGGDSGISRAVAVAFAKEGADVAISYLSEQEDEDARHTAELVGKAGRRCV